MGGEAAHFLLFRHEIKCVADHFGGFRAWIPERSDFFKGPKGPKGPLGPERSDFFKGPKNPKAPLAATRTAPQAGRTSPHPNTPRNPRALRLPNLVE